MGGGKKSKKKKLAPSTIPIATLGTNEGVPIQGNFGPGLGSERTSGEDTTVRGASPSVEGGRPEVLSFTVFESDDALGKEFWKAVEGGNFEWFEENMVRW